jgi:acyl carrier protein
MQKQIRRFILTSFLFTEDESQLKDDDSLLERGVMDSTGVLELVAFLEETFGVKLSDDELVPENLDSVRQIVAFVQRKQGVSTSTTSAAR